MCHTKYNRIRFSASPYANEIKNKAKHHSNHRLLCTELKSYKCRITAEQNK